MLESALEAPPDTKVVLQCNIFDHDHQTRALLVDRDFAQVREWIHLKIELDTPPPAPQLPDHLIVRMMDQRRDWPLVGVALEEAFADHWGQLRPSVEIAANDPDDDANDYNDVDEVDADNPYFNSHDFSSSRCTATRL